MNKKFQSNEKIIFPKNNPEIVFPENTPIFSNISSKNEKKEDFITFQKQLKMEEKPDLNRISNLKDNELTLEDQLQIQKQINDDYDNDDQIEVIENILNNFGKEKNKNKEFMLYKNKNKMNLNLQKNKYKSNSVINRNNTHNKILNKIKKDIALINFQQEINKIHKLHNYKIFLKNEKAHFTSLKKANLEKENNLTESQSKNKNRIEEIKKKLYSKNQESKSSNKNNEIRTFINTFNIKRKKEKFFKSKNDKAFNQILEEINNLKLMKINNSIYNTNNYNNNKNFCNTFRIRINHENFINSNNKENSKNNELNKNKKNVKENGDHLKTEDSSNISLYDSNQFFYTVYKHAIKKYPYLYLLKNKINKMKSNDVSKSQTKFKDKTKKEENISLLDKINSQRDIFQREIEQHNSK